MDRFSSSWVTGMAYSEMVVIDVTRNSRIQKRVQERVAAGLCLFQFEDGSFCGCKATDRGRCNPHYQKFNLSVRKCRTAADRKKFEAAVIKAGLILESHEICDLKRKDPESVLLSEFTQ